jgi:hypothetical protein
LKNSYNYAHNISPPLIKAVWVWFFRHLSTYYKSNN